MQSFPLLSLAIWVPILFGAAVLWMGSDRNPRPARWLALTGSIVGLLLTIPLVTGFDNHVATAQFVEHLNWIPEFDITYHLGLDGVSLGLGALPAFTRLGNLMEFGV